MAILSPQFCVGNLCHGIDESIRHSQLMIVCEFSGRIGYPTIDRNKIKFGQGAQRQLTALSSSMEERPTSYRTIAGINNCSA